MVLQYNTCTVKEVLLLERMGISTRRCSSFLGYLSFSLVQLLTRYPVYDVFFLILFMYFLPGIFISVLTVFS